MLAFAALTLTASRNTGQAARVARDSSRRSLLLSVPLYAPLVASARLCVSRRLALDAAALLRARAGGTASVRPLPGGAPTRRGPGRREHATRAREPLISRPLSSPHSMREIGTRLVTRPPSRSMRETSQSASVFQRNSSSSRTSVDSSTTSARSDFRRACSRSRVRSRSRSAGRCRSTRRSGNAFSPRSRTTPRSPQIVRHHHERMDGMGYPDGIAGEEIPLISRIIAVADAYNAMTSDRPYRDAMPSRVARMRLAQGVEGQFDTTDRCGLRGDSRRRDGGVPHGAASTSRSTRRISIQLAPLSKPPKRGRSTVCLQLEVRLRSGTGRRVSQGCV